MRSKTPLILGVILFVLIIVGVIYARQQSAVTAPESIPAAIASAAPAGVTAMTGSPAPTGSGAVAPPASAAKAPDLSVDSNGLSKATVFIQTTKGLIKFKFYPKDAPETVNRIAELINQGFYNGLSFHRVVPDFVIQGGDPLGNGTGGSGHHLKAEFNSRRHIEGAVAMARAQDPDSADSQFYIALKTLPSLDHNYTVFGQVIEGMDVVRSIQVGDKMTVVRIE